MDYQQWHGSYYFFFGKAKPPLVNGQCILLIKLSSPFQQTGVRGMAKCCSLFQGQKVEIPESIPSSPVQEVMGLGICILHSRGTKVPLAVGRNSPVKLMGWPEREPQEQVRNRSLISGCFFFFFFFNSDRKSQKLYSSSSVHSVPCN